MTWPREPVIEGYYPARGWYAHGAGDSLTSNPYHSERIRADWERGWKARQRWILDYRRETQRLTDAAGFVSVEISALDPSTDGRSFMRRVVMAAPDRRVEFEVKTRTSSLDDLAIDVAIRKRLP